LPPYPRAERAANITRDEPPSVMNPRRDPAATAARCDSYAIVGRLANNLRARFPGGRPRRFTLLGGAGIAALACAATVMAAAAAPTVRIHTASGEVVTVTVELAATPARQTRGLMFRRRLAPMHGMLFLFADDSDRAFWMKNTPLSLDIVFIDAHRRIVGISAHTVPYSERELRAGKPSRYVLEVEAGFCEREGVGVGDRLEFAGIDASAAAGS